jgi:cytidine deaminase
VYRRGRGEVSRDPGVAASGDVAVAISASHICTDPLRNAITVENLRMDSKPICSVETSRIAAIGTAETRKVRVSFDSGLRVNGALINVTTVSMSNFVDWKMLRGKAIASAANAYAPYSRLRVGAAGLTEDHRVLTGCNVENVSYGLSLCAECAVVCALHTGGGGRLAALTCVDAAGTLLMPCGRCRQVLLEHGGAGLWIDHPERPRRLGELLPEAFGPGALP